MKILGLLLGVGLSMFKSAIPGSSNQKQNQNQNQNQLRYDFVFVKNLPSFIKKFVQGDNDDLAFSSKSLAWAGLYEIMSQLRPS